MLSEKIIAIAAVVVVFGFIFGTIVYSETIVDENRFLRTDLGTYNQTILGQPLDYSFDVQVVEMLPGAETGWHTHDKPLLGYIVHGSLEVTYCEDWVDNQCIDEFTKIYHHGDFLVEAIDTYHNGKNTGPYPVKIHVVVLN